MNKDLFKILKIVPAIANIIVSAYFYTCFHSIVLTVLFSFFMSFLSIVVIGSVTDCYDDILKTGDLSTNNLEDCVEKIRESYWKILPYTLSCYVCFYIILDLIKRHCL